MITRLMNRLLALLVLAALAGFTTFFPLIGRAATAPIAARATDTPPPAPDLDWRVTGPTGGDVRALVVDPSDPQRFYFGTLDGQIYTSTDGGASWRLLYNFQRPKLFVDHIIVDPRDSKMIYVACHRHKDPGGFFKTVDGGVTWREAAELKDEALHSMTQSTVDPNILIVGTNDGVYRSVDAGDTWTKLGAASTPGLVNVESLAIDPRNTNTIYAGTWYLPYKSTDGGNTWNVIKKGIIDDSDIFAINIDPRNPDHIIASACSGIYDTRTGGGLWRKVQGIPSQSRRTRAILQHPSLPNLVFAGTTEGFWRSTRGGEDGSWMLTTSKQLEINSIAVHPRNPNTVFIGTNNYGVMVSRDAGKTFVPSNGGYSGRFINSILADREMPNRIYATTINTATGGGFFFVSNDGGDTWQPSMRNMPARLSASSILQDDRNASIIYLGTGTGLYRSLDRGESWAPLGAPRPAPPPRRRGARRRGSTAAQPPAAAAPRRADNTIRRAQEALLAAGYDVGTPDGAAGPRTVAALRKFQADRGIDVSGKVDDATLTALGLTGDVRTAVTVSGNTPAPAVFLSEPINALARIYNERGEGAGLLAATNGGVYRTSDPAQGWEKLSFGGALDPRTTCISTSPQSPKMIWTGTVNSGLIVSRDGGATWQQAEGIPPTAPISSIAQDLRRPGNIYVGTKQTLYLSRDGGEHWTRRGGNLPYGDYASIAINPQNSEEVLVGDAYQNDGGGFVTINTGGVYRSTDAGMTWTRVDPRDRGLPSQRIWALAFGGGAPLRLFVGSHSAGVYVVERGEGRAAAASSGNQ